MESGAWLGGSRDKRINGEAVMLPKGQSNWARAMAEKRVYKSHFTCWSGLNKNVHYRLINLSAWFPVSGTIWERLGVSSLEWACPCWGSCVSGSEP